MSVLFVDTTLRRNLARVKRNSYGTQVGHIWGMNGSTTNCLKEFGRQTGNFTALAVDQGDMTKAWLAGKCVNKDCQCVV